MTHPFQTAAGLFRRLVSAAVLTAYIGAGLFGHLSVGDDDVYTGTELQVTEKKDASVTVTQRPLWTKKRHFPPVPAFSIADVHQLPVSSTVSVRTYLYHAALDPLRSVPFDASVRIPRAPPILLLL